MYWIDPNGGCNTDSFQVHCDFEDGGCSTCIDTANLVCIICSSRFLLQFFFNTLFINITVYFLGYFTKGRTSITRNLLATEFSSWQSKSISHCLVSITVHRQLCPFIVTLYQFHSLAKAQCILLSVILRFLFSYSSLIPSARLSSRCCKCQATKPNRQSLYSARTLAWQPTQLVSLDSREESSSSHTLSPMDVR